MKLFIFMVLFVLLAGISLIEPHAYQETLGREFTLETTFDPDRYAVFRAQGDTIHAEGVFKSPAVESFYVYCATMRGAENSITKHSDGSFSAVFNGSTSAKSAEIIINLEDGGTLRYRVEYNSDVGWFFGDNGLAASTAAALEDYQVIPPEISELYLGRPEELAETREKLRGIVAGAAEDLDCDYQIAKALSLWVSENIVYDHDAAANEVNEETVSVASTLRLRRSVCIGIANTYAALLEAAGLKVLNIKGGVASGGVIYEQLPFETTIHEWVAFWFEAGNRWVYADPTWDRLGVFRDGEFHHSPPVMKYFDISPLALSFDHRGDSAELREFFAINNEELIMNNEHEFDNIPPAALAPEAAPPPEENDDFLYMTIGALSLSAVIMLLIIIKMRRK
jgi:transglutaminase-like putative cysteine protease